MESKVDVNVASSAEDAQQLSRKRTQEVDCEVNNSWAAVYQSIARRMLSCEAFKVSTKELEEHVFHPDEPSVDIEHIVRQARGEKHKKMFQMLSRHGAKEILAASVARREEHLRMLIVLEREVWILAKRSSN